MIAGESDQRCVTKFFVRCGSGHAGVWDARERVAKNSVSIEGSAVAATTDGDDTVITHPVAESNMRAGSTPRRPRLMRKIES
jgi:hypothetical protein